MRATVLHRPRDIRCEEVAEPKILFPTDAIIKLSATCICDSDLWPYRGLQDVNGPMHMGHEYCGIVMEVGSEVTTVRPGEFVVGSFCISDNTCPHCQFGFQSSCMHREFMSGAQAPYARVPLADGTLVPTRDVPSDELVPHFLTTSDVLGTGWYAADAANVREGSTVVVVGDGAVGLMGVLAAKEMGAEQIIAMSRHKTRQELALSYGATDIVAERGDDGVARVLELTNGIGAESVLECVGPQEAMSQALACTRPGGTVGYVGVPHSVTLDGQRLFFGQKRMLGGPAPVRRFLPDLMDGVLKGKIRPGKVFGDIAPHLAEITDKVLFGDVWQNPALSQRDRSLVTITSLISLYRVNELPFHLKRALENGLTRDEIIGAITQLAFYAGWPPAMTALQIARKVFEEAAL